MISPLKGNWEETSFIIPPPKKKCFYVKQGGTKQFTLSAHRCKSCHFFQMQKSLFSFLVPSIQPHTFHLHLAILCPSARVLHHKEETKEASSNKLRRQNTYSFNRFFFVFFKEEKQEARLLPPVNPATPQHSIPLVLTYFRPRTCSGGPCGAGGEPTKPDPISSHW